MADRGARKGSNEGNFFFFLMYFEHLKLNGNIKYLSGKLYLISSIMKAIF